MKAWNGIVVGVAVLAPVAIGQGTGGDWSSLSWGDWNGDGLSDVVALPVGGELRLLENDGVGGLADATALAGLADVAGMRQALWSDFDGDGRQDLLLVSSCCASKLLRNGADGRFVDVSAASCVDLEGGLLRARWLDFDADGRPDLQLAGTASERLYHNLGDGLFEELPLELGGAQVASVGGSSISALAPPTVVGDPTANRQLLAGPTGICAGSLFDLSAGKCIRASSLPKLGRLYPLGPELNIDGTGRVGIGTLTPAFRLDVAGDVRSSGRLISTVTSGPPLDVSSTAKVWGLNADLLDGLDASDFTQLGSTIEGTEITDGSIDAPDLAPGAVTGVSLAPGSVTNAHVSSFAGIQGAKIDPHFGAQDVVTLGALGVGKAPTTAKVDVETGAGTAVRGKVTGTSGFTWGVEGTIASDEGAGVIGVANAAAGASFGVFGLTQSPDGLAVYGYAAAPTGGTGVHGETDAVDGVGVKGWSTDLSDYGIGVYGRADSPGGDAVYGHATATTGNAWGVRGESDSSGGAGVIGYATAATGSTFGVAGQCQSPEGYGVIGLSSADTGETAGVQGSSYSSSGYGVRGYAYEALGTGIGAYGETQGAQGDGVRGWATATTGQAWGVSGITDSDTGVGVAGLAGAAAGSTYGVFGLASSPTGYGVYASGDLGASGTKSFVQPHPSDPSKEIRFVCLEGNESGTYFRGTGSIQGGSAVIEVPEEFRLVTEASGLTVQVTPFGAPAAVWIESQDLMRIVVRANADVDFHYFVNGVRRGFAGFEPMRENRAFVPAVRGVPYGTQYPDELREVLVQSGILNPDFTPNEATAASLGWKLVDAGSRAAARYGHGPGPGERRAAPTRK